MEFESATNNTTAKLPILKLGEYELWVIRIKQYFQVQDDALWEVKQNGNEATKKTQMILLKQQYENFNASSTESLDSIFNMIQKIVSRLKILGVVITQEDLNSKFLRSLPHEWNTHVVVWMNKADIETMSIDDLYNNFKIVEQDVKKSIGASIGTQNMAFMIALSTSSTNDVNTANPAYEASTQDLEQIHEDDLEAMDLRWQLSLLSMRAKRWDTLPENAKHKGTKMVISGIKTTLGTATYKRGLATVEEQIVTYKKNKFLFSEEVAVLKREVGCKDYEINVLKSKFEKVKQVKEGIELKIENFDKASKSLDKLIGSQITKNSKKGLGYHVVHPLIYNGPTKLDLSYSGLDEFKEPEFKGYGHRDKQTSSFVESPLNVDKETAFSINKTIEFVKSKHHDKPVRKSVRPYIAPVNTNREKRINAVKASACWVWRPTRPNGASLVFKRHNYIDGKPQKDDKGFIDSGCSRYMTRNIAYLSDFKEFDRDYVTFGGGAHGGRISRKSKEVRTLRYLSLVVPLKKVGDEAIHKELGDRIERAATTASSLEAEQDNGSGPRCQDTILRDVEAQTRFEAASKQFNDLPLSRVNTLGCGKDNIKLKELIDFCTILSEYFWETASSSTYENGEIKITATIDGRVKSITKASISRHLKLEDYEGPILQSDPTILPPPISSPSRVPTSLHDLPLPGDISTANVPVTTAGAKISTASLKDKTAKRSNDSDDITLAETLIEIRISATKPQKVKGVTFRDVEETPRLIRSTTTLQPLPSIDLKDKGKGVLVKEEHVKLKRRDQGLARIESDAELAQRLYKEELAEVDRAQKERQKQEEATIADLIKEFNEIQARMDTDHEHATRQTYEVQEQFTIKERAKLADRSSKNYKTFSEILNDFDRQDVIDLYRLVQERYDTTGLKGYDLLLWGDLKILFEPNEEDEICKNQQDYNLISWRLFDSCGVHILLMNNGIAIHMLIEKTYPLTQEMISRMLNRRLKVDHESKMAFELLRFTRPQLKE
nr:hypothetical protein [Tanacetum cinerariifolium]